MAARAAAVALAAAAVLALSAPPAASARAPLEIGNHFATWNHGAYVRALTRFVDTVCVKPEVRCVTYSTLVDWLRSRPAAWLERDRDGRFTAMPARSG